MKPSSITTPKRKKKNKVIDDTAIASLNDFVRTNPCSSEFIKFKFDPKNGSLLIELLDEKSKFLTRVLNGFKHIFCPNSDGKISKLREFKIHPSDYDTMIRILLAAKFKKTSKQTNV